MADIRDAIAADAPALLELATALTTEAGGGAPEVRMTPDGLRRDLETGAANGLIAEVDGDTVGFATFSFMHFSLSGVHVYLDDLYVHPEHRGSGIGRQLMSVLADRARERGCAGMTWFVERANARAIRFYERMGARIAQTRAIMSTHDLNRVVG
jgi:ribosomal protein S18 acetylase RimI-like enzyme